MKKTRKEAATNNNTEFLALESNTSNILIFLKNSIILGLYIFFLVDEWLVYFISIVDQFNLCNNYLQWTVRENQFLLSIILHSI